MSDDNQIDLLPDDDTGPLPGLVDVGTEKWGKVLAGMVDLFTALFRRRGRSLDEATEEAQVVVMELANYQGGREVYLPRGDRLLKAIRDRRIYLEHTGRNEAELAQRYELTPRQIRQINAEQRATQVAKRQGKLFG